MQYTIHVVSQDRSKFLLYQHGEVKNVSFLSYVYMNPVTEERCVHFLKSLLRQTFLIKTPDRGQFLFIEEGKIYMRIGEQKEGVPEYQWVCWSLNKSSHGDSMPVCGFSNIAPHSQFRTSIHIKIQQGLDAIFITTQQLDY